MSKYTAEQVEAEIANYAEEAFPREEIDLERVTDMLRDYAAHLRERESAKAAVTDEMVLTAIRAWDGVAPQLEYGHRFRAALEAVAPMLASARVPDDKWLKLAQELEVYKEVVPSPIGPLHGAGMALAYQNVAKTIRYMLAAAPKPEEE